MSAAGDGAGRGRGRGRDGGLALPAGRRAPGGSDRD